MEYLVNVTILQVAGLVLGEKEDDAPNPYCVVQALGETHQTNTVTDASTAVFGHTFSISKNMKEEDFLASDIEIIVYHDGYGGDTELGHVIFSLRKVYVIYERSVPKDWFQLTKRGLPAEGAGYAQVTISAYGPQDPVPRSFLSYDTQGEGTSLKSRIVQPPMSGKAGKVKNIFQLMVRVHRAESLRSVSGLLSDGVDPFVKVDFHGATASTDVKSNDPSPQFNQEIRMPFQMPCWDDSVNVIVATSGRGGVSEEAIGEVIFHIDDLEKKESPPKWYNFYCAPKEAELGLASWFTGTATVEDSAFAGRVLLSACLERTETTMQSVVPAQKPREPVTTKGCLWVDVYQVCIDGENQPTKVCVSATLGANFGHDNACAATDRTSHAFVWAGEEGRIPQGNLNVGDKEQTPDLIISIHGTFPKAVLGFALDGNWDRYAFVRIPAADIWNWNKTGPKWYELLLVMGSAGPKNAGFILMSANLGRDKDKPKKRPDREPMQTSLFKFRANLYQAVDLPWHAKDGGTDPQVVMFYGPAMLHSGTASWTNNPTWNQIMEDEVELPTNVRLRPDVIIYVLNKMEESDEPLAMCRYQTDSNDLLPAKWTGDPIWLDLHQVPGSLPVRQPKLLASFELIPVSEQDLSTDGGVVGELFPDTLDCRVDFYAMGIRMSTPGLVHRDPILVVGWGRDQKDPPKMKKQRVTSSGIGKDGDFNFLQKLSIGCNLSKKPVHQDWLEVRLLAEGSEDGEMQVVAFAMIQLTPLAPWLTQKERKSAHKRFHMHMANEADSAEEDEEEESEDDDADAESPKKEEAKDTATLLAHKEEHLCKLLGWDAPSIEASNVRKLDHLHFINMDDEDQSKADQELSTQRVRLRRSMVADRNSVSGMDDGEAEDIMASLNALVDHKKKGPKDKKKGWREEVAEHAVHFGAPKTSTPQFTETLTLFAEQFSWPKPLGGGEGLDMHPDLDVSLEDGPLAVHPLPYLSSPLFVGSELGEPLKVGVLKYCLNITEKDKAETPQAKDAMKKFEEKIKTIETTLKTCTDLTIRAYVLSADGLIPLSGASSVETYVQSRLDEGGDPRFTYIDDSTKREGRHPQYHSCHTFGHCNFPGHCTLRLQVHEAGSSGDDVVGGTRIDLEDRWFLARYQEMVKNEIVPIESRKLMRSDSRFGKGHLRLWVDVMTASAAHSKRVVPLPSTESVPFQLRVVIWKVEKLAGDGINVFVMGKHMLNTGKPVIDRTDTHLNVNDGTATFNWRLIFNLFIPCQDPRLLIRVVDDGYLDDDAIGEVNFDFARDFMDARKGNCSVEMEKSTIALSHPAFEGDPRCEVTLQAKLLPMEEAMAQPAGAGWNEPNEDPFVDPEDPHLKAHREFFNNLALVRGAKALAGGLFMFGKYMTLLYGAAAVLSGLFTVTMSIIMVTK